MADSKISALAAAGALAGGDAFPIVQGGATRRSTVAAIATWLGSTLGLVKATTTAGAPGVNDDGNAGYSVGSSWLDTASGLRWTCRSAAVGAAEWTAAGGLDHPGYVSGRCYSAQRGTLAASGAAVAADLLYAVPIYVAQRATISDLMLRVTTGVAGNAKVGIYDSVAGGPGARLAELATPASTGTAATVVAALTANITLNPGLYWLAAIFSAAPSCTTISSSDQFIVGLVGGTSAVDVFAASSSNAGVQGSGATYAGGLPASFGTSSPRGATPLLGFRVA